MLQNVEVPAEKADIRVRLILGYAFRKIYFINRRLKVERVKSFMSKEYWELIM